MPRMPFQGVLAEELLDANRGWVKPFCAGPPAQQAPATWTAGPQAKAPARRRSAPSGRRLRRS
jgi:hypothetical protein